MFSSEREQVNASPDGQALLTQKDSCALKTPAGFHSQSWCSGPGWDAYRPQSLLLEPSLSSCVDGRNRQPVLYTHIVSSTFSLLALKIILLKARYYKALWFRWQWERKYQRSRDPSRYLQGNFTKEGTFDSALINLVLNLLLSVKICNLYSMSNQSTLYYIQIRIECRCNRYKRTLFVLWSDL